MPNPPDPYRAAERDWSARKRRQAYRAAGLAHWRELGSATRLPMLPETIATAESVRPPSRV